jgi:hypothetical protein
MYDKSLRSKFQRIMLAAGFSLLSLLTAFASTNPSAWVYPGSDGRLIYQPDAWGNRILDFSGVGYKGGLVPLPSSNAIPVTVPISPVSGDNTAHIQAAINLVSSLPLKTNGFRGEVFLNAGIYPCAGTININASGVVLRGAGGFTNETGTVIEATASNQYTLIEISGSGSAATVSGTTHTITTPYVPVGARSFYVDSASGLSVGQSVYVRRVATQNWIDDLGMNLLGPPPDEPWTPGGYMINMERVITHIEGNHIFIDEPIPCAIDALHYTNGTIRAFTWPGRITNCAVEDIFGKSDYFGSTTNETHGWTFIRFDKVVDGWVRDVACEHFGYACVNLGSGAKYITVQDCQSLDPVSIITGGRRYAFVINDCQLCLFKNCYTRNDRHQFVTQSLTIGPTAFVDGVSDDPHAEAGPHQRWATGILWDNIAIHGNNNDIQNAGNYGTGHGWEGANCVIWNNAAKGFIVQSPPGANNWLIGSIGSIQNSQAWNIGYPDMPHAPGNYDSSGASATNVFPNSLYFSQLQNRLAAPGLQTRDYWLGVIDGFTNTIPRDIVPVDTTWSNAVNAAAAGQPLDPFNVVTNHHWIPFTFNFSLAPTEHVVAATLSLAMRSVAGGGNDVIYLDSLTNDFPFSSLGWLPIGTGTNTTVRVMDLSSHLSLLAGGKLDVAIQNDGGIDWAMLELQIAPNITAFTNSLLPVADAYVRGGASASDNYGAGATLAVKTDASTSYQRVGYLRWDLSAVTGVVDQALVRLTPVSVGTNGYESGVSLGTNDDWSETGITWDNQPGAVSASGGTAPPGERFATWSPVAGSPVEFAVTPQVQAALAGDKQLTLQLFSIQNSGGGSGIAYYASRENPDPSARPQLILLTSSPLRKPTPTFNAVGLSGNNLLLAGTNGLAGQDYYLLAGTNLAEPLSNWIRLTTNRFDENGKFTLTNGVNLNPPQLFYLLQVP